MESSADCVIVGGGIGGAVLALILGRGGRRVVLLEKETAPQAVRRPEILAEATMEIFRELGAGERILEEAALPLQGLEVYRARGGPLLSFSAEDFRRNHTQPYSTDPARTREILLEAAVATHSVDLRRGVEVEEVIREGGRIGGVRAAAREGSLVFRAPFVVGDDGAHSRIREAMGISLKLRDFPLEFFGASGPELPGGKPFTGEVRIHPGGLKKGIFGGVFMPLAEKRTAFVFLLSPEARARLTEAPRKFYEAVNQILPRGDNLEKDYPFPESFTLFRRPFGHAPRYTAEGAVLLGDAAHPLTPAGGQGANASVADARALGRVLLENRPLFHYESLRREANERSLRFSLWANRVFRTFRVFPWGAPLLPWFLKKLDRSPKMRNNFLRNVSNAFRTNREDPIR